MDRTDTRTIGATGERCGEPVTVLVESSVPAPRMIIFGAVDFASALVRVGKLLGYHVSVCDARPVFATPERFPEADEVVTDWPHRYLDAQVTRSARAAMTEPDGAHVEEGPGPWPTGTGASAAASTAVPCCACSPTTPSSTSRSSNARCGCRSATSAPWAPGAPTWTGCAGCAPPA